MACDFVQLRERAPACRFELRALAGSQLRLDPRGDVPGQLGVARFVAYDRVMCQSRMKSRKFCKRVSRAAITVDVDSPTAAKKLGRKALRQLDTLVTPETLLRSYRRLVAAKYDSRTSPARARV